MGRNTDEANTEIKGNEMTDTEFAELNRENVYSADFDLWCSIDRQLDYQKMFLTYKFQLNYINNGKTFISRFR